MIEAEIPEPLAKEAKMNTTTRQEADEYVLEKVQDMDIKLTWPN